MYELPSSEQPNINREHDTRVANGLLERMMWDDFMHAGISPFTEHGIKIANIAYARDIPIGEAAALYAEQTGDEIDYNDPTHQLYMDVGLNILCYYKNIDANNP